MLVLVGTGTDSDGATGAAFGLDSATSGPGRGAILLSLSVSSGSYTSSLFFFYSP